MKQFFPLFVLMLILHVFWSYLYVGWRMSYLILDILGWWWGCTQGFMYIIMISHLEVHIWLTINSLGICLKGFVKDNFFYYNDPFSSCLYKNMYFEYCWERFVTIGYAFQGADCEYRHSEIARLNPRECWFWVSGACLNPTCAFRHPVSFHCDFASYTAYLVLLEIFYFSLILVCFLRFLLFPVIESYRVICFLI